VSQHSDDLPQWSDYRRDSVSFIREILQSPIADWQRELLMCFDEGKLPRIAGLGFHGR
jgi:hypothetical protein